MTLHIGDPNGELDMALCGEIAETHELIGNPNGIWTPICKRCFVIWEKEPNMFKRFLNWALWEKKFGWGG